MQLTITRPDDWHLHIRDGEALAAVLPDTCRQMGRAIIMPNLKPPVTTVEAAAAYRERILAARPAGSHFEPLMTLYLTEGTMPADIERAAASGLLTVMRTTSEPACASACTCCTVAAASAVSVLVIDCTITGCPEPTITWPMATCWV